MTNTVVDTAVMASHCGLSNSTMQHVSDVIAKTKTARILHLIFQVRA